MTNQPRRCSRRALRRTFTLLSLCLFTVGVTATLNANGVRGVNRYLGMEKAESHSSYSQSRTARSALSFGRTRPHNNAFQRKNPTTSSIFVRGGSTAIPKPKSIQSASTVENKTNGSTNAANNDASSSTVSSPSTQSQSLSSTSWNRSDMIVFFTSSFLTTASSAFVAFSPAPALIEEIGSERATSTLSILGSSAALTEIIISPALGSLLDSIGRKPAFLVAMAIIAAVNGVVAINPTVITICAAKFVKTLCFGSFLTTSQVMISDIAVSNPERMSSVLGIYFALSACAFFVGAIIAGKLSEFGLSVTYGASTIVSSLTVMLVLFGLKESLDSSKRIPFAENKSLIKKQLLQSPLSSCTSILTRHTKEVRILAILIMIQSLPSHMHDTFQILVRSEWGVGMKEFSSFIAIYGMINIFSNVVGSQLVIKLGIKYFTGMATLSSALAPLGASLFSFRGMIIGLFAGFLAPAQMLGVTSALYVEGAKSNVPQGELAGERSSFLALAKVVGPLWYSFLYVKGKQVFGTGFLPFLFNVTCALTAFGISQRYLPSSVAAK